MNKHTRSVSLIDGHIEEMTDAEVIKALECCSNDGGKNDCLVCPNLKSTENWECKEDLPTVALDLIKRIQAKNKEFDEKLIIQKGLIDTQKAEIEKLNVELVGMRGACESYKIHYDNAQAEIERLNIRNKALTDITKNYDWKFAKVKSEAIKEFWKRFDKVLCENIGPSKRVYWKISSDGDNLVKEMTEVKKIENTESN